MPEMRRVDRGRLVAAVTFLDVRISNRAHVQTVRVRGSIAAAAYFFLRRFRRSRRFLEPIFLLRLGLAMKFLLHIFV